MSDSETPDEREVILGKSLNWYTKEQISRILTEFNEHACSVLQTSENLHDKLRKCVKDHPKLDIKMRKQIEKQHVFLRPSSYEILDDHGRYTGTGYIYPKQLDVLLAEIAQHASDDEKKDIIVMELKLLLQHDNTFKLNRCYRYLSEIGLNIYLMRKPEHVWYEKLPSAICVGCLRKDIKKEIQQASE